MCPVGSRCILGYRGNWKPEKFAMFGFPGISALHCCPFQISVVLFALPSVSFKPEVVMMVPSLSSVSVGYQRPCAVGAMSIKDSLEGSKMDALGRPVNGMSP